MHCPHPQIPLKHTHTIYAVCSVWDKGYRYGFNGKEIDKGDEGMGGGGSTYDYGFRIYNPSLGKFLSVDPLTASYPWYTPYQFAGNKPIWAIDLDGLEEYFTQDFTLKNSKGVSFTYKVFWKEIPLNSRADIHGKYYKLQSKSFININLSLGVLRNFNIKKSELKAKKDQAEFSIIDNSLLSKTISIERNKMKRKSNLLTLFVSPKVFLDNDGGNTKEKLKNQMQPNGKLEVLDNLVSVLINDPNAKVEIIGSASRKPTNIGGTQTTLSEENNLILANQRAEAGKELLKDILKNEYHKTDEEINTLMKRVSIKSVVNGSTEDSDEDAKKNRHVEFKLK